MRSVGRPAIEWSSNGLSRLKVVARGTRGGILTRVSVPSISIPAMRCTTSNSDVVQTDRFMVHREKILI